MLHLSAYSKLSARRYKNHIGITHPDIAKTLHPTKNTYGVENLTHGSDSRNVWWLCPVCQKEWSCTAFRRIHKQQNCPTCEANKFPIDQSLGYCYPHLLAEWDHERNAPLTPFIISSYSQRSIWWTCQKCDHQWSARPHSRTRQKTGCPVCQRKKHREHLKKINLIVRENNLSVTHPHLEIAWDQEKNYPITFKHVTPGSQRRTWWMCPHCNHSFSKLTFSLINSTQTCKECKKTIYNAS